MPPMYLEFKVSASNTVKYDLPKRKYICLLDGTNIGKTSQCKAYHDKNSAADTRVSFPYTMPTKDLEWELILPTYTWTETVEEEVHKWSCTATYLGDNGQTITETATEDAASGEAKVTYVVKQKSTKTVQGNADYTAVFKTYSNYFDTQVDNKLLPLSTVHEHNDVEEFKPWDDAAAAAMYGSGKTAATCLPNTGDYYLTCNVTVTNTTTIASGKMARICLYGHAIIANFGSNYKSIFENNGTLKLYDCNHKDPSSVHYFTASGNFWKYSTNTTANAVTGGVITGATKSAVANYNKLECYDVNFVGNENQYMSGNYEVDGSGGGAIRHGSKNNTTSMNLQGCSFLHNQSKGSGGAITFNPTGVNYKSNPATINECIFDNNHQLYDYAVNYGGEGSWGGGAICAGPTSTTYTINISGSEFMNNSTMFRGGAIMLGHGVTLNLSDTSIHNNKSGKTSDTFGTTPRPCYGGGIAYYNGDPSNYSTTAYLYLNGVVRIENNHNAYEDPDQEDNLSVSKSNTYVQLNSTSNLKDGSLVGISYSYEKEGCVSNGYGNIYGKNMKYFVMDEIQSRKKYAVLLKTNTSPYELYIHKHVHKFNTSLTSSLSSSQYSNPASDTATIKCIQTETTDSDGTFSQCKYGLEPCQLTIKSRDGGEDIKGDEPLEYSAEGHPATLENQHEFETQTFGKFATGFTTGDHVKYQQLSKGSQGEDIWTDIDSVPKMKGTYRAYTKINPVSSISGDTVSYSSSTVQITSNAYSIGAAPLTLQCNGIDKVFDDTTAIKITDNYTLTGGLKGQTFTLNTTNFIGYVAEKDKYVGTNKQIIGYDASSVKLSGTDAELYYIKEIKNSYVANITPATPTIGFGGTAVSFNCDEKLPLKNNVIAPAYDFKYTFSETGGGDWLTFETIDGQPYASVDSSKWSSITSHIATKVTGKSDPLDLNNDGTADYNGVNFTSPNSHEWVNVFKKGGAKITVSFGSDTTAANATFVSNSLEFTLKDGDQAITYTHNLNSDDNTKVDIHDSSNIGWWKEGLSGWNKDKYELTGFTVKPDTGTEVPVTNKPQNFSSACNSKIIAHFKEIPKPDIKVTQACDVPEGTKVNIGKKINYTFTIKNPGNTDLTDIKLYDDFLGYTESKPMTIDNIAKGGSTTKTVEYEVKETDIMEGSITNNVNVTGKYGTTTVSSTADALVNPTEDIKTNLVVTATPTTDKTYYIGDNITYNITVKNEGNTTMKGVELDYTLLGVSDNTAKIAIGNLVPGATSTTQTTSNYTIRLNEITQTGEDAGYLVNTVYATGTYQTKTGDVPVTGTSDPVKTKIGYKKVAKEDEPTPRPSTETLTYNGLQQSGVVTPEYYCGYQLVNDDVNKSIAKDAGSYTAKISLDPFYTWEDDSTEDMYINWKIKPKELMLTVDVNQDYTGQQFSHKIVSSGIEAEITGFVPSGEIYEGLSTDIPSTVATNGSDVLYDDEGVVKPYTEEGTATNQLTINLVPDTSTTNLNNYYITSSLSLKIKPYTLDSSSTRISKSASNLTYNTEEQTNTTISFTDTTTNTVLTEGTHFNFVEGTNKGTNAGDYDVKIKGLGNYKGETTFPKLWTMNKADITIQITGDTHAPYTYDGTEKSLPAGSTSKGYTATITSGETEKIKLDTNKIYPGTTVAKGTDVGTYDMFKDLTFKYVDDPRAAEPVVDSNYNATFNVDRSTGVLSITKKSLADDDVTVEQVDVPTYNKTEKTAKFVIKINGKQLTDDQFAQEFNVTGNTATNAGDSYEATITPKDTSNFAGVLTPKWKINKYDLQIDTSSVAKTSVYKAEKISSDAITTEQFSGDKFSTVLTTNGSNVLFDSEDKVIAYSGIGEAENNLSVKTTATAGSTYADNYNISYKTTADQPTITITQRPIDVTPTPVKAAYDKAAHSLISDGVTIEEATAEKPDRGLLTSKTHVVNNQDIKFDEDENSVTDVADSKTGENGVAVKSIKVVDNNSNNLTKNYTANFIKADLEVTKAKITISVTGNKDTVEYDKSSHTNSGFVVDAKNDPTSTCTDSLFTSKYLSPKSEDCTVSATDAGTYYYQYPNQGTTGTHNLTAADFKYDDENVEATSITYNVDKDGNAIDAGYLKITPKTVVLTVNESKRSDGNPLSYTLQDKNISGLLGSDKLTGTLTTNGSAEGDYKMPEEVAGFGITANLTFDPESVASNYQINTTNVILNIRKDLMRITISGNSKAAENAVIFNGKEQTVSGYEASASEDSEGRYVFKENCLKYKDGSSTPVARGTNVGTYAMGLDVKDFVYYDPDDPTIPYEICLINDGSLQIKQAEITSSMVEAQAGTEFTYDGTLKSPNIKISKDGYTLTSKDYEFVIDETKNFTNQAVNKGEYTAVIKGKGNYAESNITIPWTIASAVVDFTITGDTKTFSYNGQEQKAIGYSWEASHLSNLVNPEYFDPSQTSDDAIAKGTIAGSYDMNLASDSFKYNDPKLNIVAGSVTINQGKLTITPKSMGNLTMTITDSEYTYNNQTYEPVIKIFDGSTELPLSDFDIEGKTSAKDQGTYTVTANAKSGGSYSGSTSANWTINPAYVELYIAGNSNSKEYDGKEGSVEGFSYTKKTTTDLPIVKGNIDPSQTCKASGTNSGVYYMGLDISKFKYTDPNYKVKFYLQKDGEYNITKKNFSSSVLLQSPKTDLVYNGNEQSPEYSVKYRLADGSLITLSEGQDFTVKGKSATNVDNYVLTVEGTGNYEGTLSLNWLIKKATLDVDIKGNHRDTDTYDGTEKVVSGYVATPGEGQTELLKLVKITPTSDNCSVKGTDANTYYMGLKEAGKFSASNTQNVQTNITVSQDGYLKINQASMDSLAVTASDLVYNGKEQTTTVTALNGKLILQEGVDYEVGGEKSATNVNTTETPSYKAKITAKANTNYTGSVDNIEWHITKANIDVDIIGEAASLPYNGETQTLSKYSVSSNSNLFNKDNVVEPATMPKASGKDVGTYAMNLTTDGFSYNDANVDAKFKVAKDGKLTIDKAKLSINVDAEKTYEAGKPFEHTLADSEIRGLQTGDTLTGKFTTNSDAVGSYVKEASYNKSYSYSLTFAPEKSKDNYDIDIAATLTILPDAADKTVYVTGENVTATYDGKAKTAKKFDSHSAMAGFEKNNVKLKEAYKDFELTQTAAGTYKMGLTSDMFEYTGATDVTFVVSDGSLTINQAEIKPDMFKVLPTEFTYDSQTKSPIVNYAGSIAGVTSNDFTVAGNSATDAGSYTLSITGKGNLKGTVSNIPWTIKKANMTINVDATQEYSGSNFVYNFVEQTDFSGYYHVDIPSEQPIVSCVTTSKSEVASYSSGDPTHGLNFTLPDNITNNYNVTNNVKLSITKRALTVTPKDKDAFTYDGKSHSLLNNEIAFTPEEGLAEGHVISNLTWKDNSITDVGTNTNVRVESMTIKDKTGADVTGSYDISYKTGKLEVVPANIKVEIAGKTSSASYDGAGHTVTGYYANEVAASPTAKITGLFDVNKIVTKTDCTASRTEIGTTNMGLTKEMFSYSDPNVNAEFSVISDGSMTIAGTSLSAVSATATNRTYNALEQETTLNVTYNGKNLIKGVDYVVTSGTTKATNADTYNIVIEGKGNYNGTQTISWEIFKADVSIEVTGNSKTYEFNGSEQSFPTGADKLYSVKETSKSGVYDASKIVYSGESVIKGTNLGTYYRELNASMFSYNDTNVNAYFDVKNDASMTIKECEIGTSLSVTANDLTYNGSDQNISIAVKFGETDLVLGKDYQFIEGSTTTAKDAGTYYASIEGIGNYKGTNTTIGWKIKPADVKISIKGTDASTVYNGTTQSASGYTPTVVKEAGSSDNLYDASCVALAVGSSDKAEGVNASTTPYTKDLTAADFVYNNKNINAIFVADASYPGGTKPGAIATVSLTINQKALIVRAVDVKKYDTKKLVHTMRNYEATGQVGNEIVGGTVSSPSADAGEYSGNDLTYNLTVDGVKLDTTSLNSQNSTNEANTLLGDTANDVTSNYTVNKDESSMKILEVGTTPYIKVTAASQTFDYDCKPHKISSTDYSIESNVDVDQTKLHVTMDTVEQTNAGEYAVKITQVTYDDTSVVETANVTSQDGKLIINKRSLSLGDISVSYTGGDLQYTGSQATPDSSKVLVNDSYATITSSDYTVSFEAGTNIGTYAIYVNAAENGNYKDSNNTGKYYVVKAKRTIKITGNNKTETYTGSTISVSDYSVSVTPESPSIISASDVHSSQTWSASNSQAGTYNMGIDINTFTYHGENKDNIDVSFELAADGYLKINPVDLSDEKVSVVIINNKDKLTYNATSQGPDKNDVKVILTTAGGAQTVLDPANYSLSGNKGVDAKTYTLTATGIGNYSGLSSVDWVIEKAKRTVKVTGNRETQVYNGSDQQVVGYSIEVSGYDPATETALVDKDLITPKDEICIAQGKNAGTYNMGLQNKEWKYGNASNVDVTFNVIEANDGYIQITQRSLGDAQLFAEPLSFVYDGKAEGHFPTIKLTYAGTELVKGQDYDLGDDVENKVNVGDYTTSITAHVPETGTCNFKNPEDGLSVAWSIIPAQIDVEIDGVRVSKVYNNKLQKASDGGAPTYVASSNSSLFDAGKVGLKEAYSVDAERTVVGTTNMNINETQFTYSDSNVTPTFKLSSDGYLNITSFDISKLTAPDPVTVVYDGNPHTPEFELKNGDTTLEAGTDYVLSGDTRATAYGDYNVSFEGTGNYHGTLTGGVWHITKRDMYIVIKGDLQSCEYDGKEHKAEGYTVNAYDDADHTKTEYSSRIFDQSKLSPAYESFCIKSTALISQSFGMTADTFTYDDDSLNVHFEVTDGGLSIGAHELEESDLIITKETSFDYNGNERTCITDVQGKEPVTIQTSDYEIINNKNTDAGDYTATIKFVSKSYSGSIDVGYKINPLDITYEPTAYETTFTGSNATHEVTLAKDPYGLVGDEKIKLTFETEQGAVHNYESGAKNGYGITLKSTEYLDGAKEKNYNLSATEKIDITKRGFDPYDPEKKTGLSVEFDNPTYNGSDLSPQNIKVKDNALNSYLDASEYEVVADPKQHVNTEGDYTFNVTSKGINYGEGSIENIKWNVQPAPITLSNTSEATYNGANIEKTFDVKTGIGTGANEESLTGTFVTTSANKGTYNVTDKSQITPSYVATSETTQAGDYKVAFAGSITIKAAGLNDPTAGTLDFQVNNPEYNGAPQTPTIKTLTYKPKVGGSEQTLGENDYELYNFTQQKDVPESGTYEIKIQGKGNYEGVASTTWTITPTKLSYELTSATKSYDGAKFSNTITLGSDQGLKGSDTASITYESESADVGSYSTSPATGEKTLTATPAFGSSTLSRNYTPNFTGTASITSKEFNPDNISVTYGCPTYTGDALLPTNINVTDKTLGLLTEKQDYEFVNLTPKTNVVDDEGTTPTEYTFGVKGIGNYAGGEIDNLKWHINPATVSADLGTKSETYNGAQISKDVTVVGVTPEAGSQEQLKVTFTTESANAGSYVCSPAAANDGKLNVVVEGVGTSRPSNYSVTSSGQINIAKKNINNETGGKITFTIQDDLPYNGDNQEPTYTVKYKPTDKDELTLVKGTDFAFAGGSTYVPKQKDVKVDGNYVETINGTGNYEGSCQAEWNISPVDITYDLQASTHTYDGSAYSQTKLFDKDSGVGLKGEDKLDVTFVTDSANVGTYTIGAAEKVLTAIPEFKEGTKSTNYNTPTFTGSAKITPKSFNPTDIRITCEMPTYDGTPVFAKNIAVYDDAVDKYKPLKEGEDGDYEVKVVKHTNVVEDGNIAGDKNYTEYEFAIEGRGNYAGTEAKPSIATKEWHIEPRELAITADTVQKEYNGEIAENTVTTETDVTIGGKTQAFSTKFSTAAKDKNTYSIDGLTSPEISTETHAIAETGAIDTNYNITSYKAQIDIIARKVTVYIDEKKWFDGKPLAYDFTKDNVKKTGETTPGMVNNESVTGQFVTDGAKAFTYEYITGQTSEHQAILKGGAPTPGSGTDLNNYEIAYDVTLTINSTDLKDATVELGDLLKYDKENPQPQTQTISSVVLADYELELGSDYTVKAGTATQTEPGKYQMILEAVPGGNFTGSKTVTYVIVGPEEQDLKKISDDIVVDVVNDGDTPTGEIETKPGELVGDVVTADEIAAVADGKYGLHVWVSIKDISKTIEAESKSLLDAEVAKVDGRQTAQYDDISLYKTLIDLSTKEEDTTQIHEVKNPVGIKLVAPESMRPGPDVESRVLGLIRNHDGDVKEMKTEYVEADYTLRFASDKFSDYALTKVDTMVPQPEPQPDPVSPDNAASSGATGDGNALVVVGLAMLALLISAGTIWIRRRRQS